MLLINQQTKRDMNKQEIIDLIEKGLTEIGYRIADNKGANTIDYTFPKPFVLQLADTIYNKLSEQPSDVVNQQRELIKSFQEHYQSGEFDDERTFDWNVEKFLTNKLKER